MCAGWAAGPVILPEGYDPDACVFEEEVLPLTVGGKAVAGRDGDFLVGENLEPHSDDAVITFEPEQAAAASAWLKEYGWSRQLGFAEAWRAIEAALRR